MLFHMLTSNNENYVKFALFLLRVYSSENENESIQAVKDFSFLCESGLLNELLNHLKTTIDDSIIVSFYID